MSLIPALSWRSVAAVIVVILLAVVYAEVKHVGHLEAQLDAAAEIANVNAEIANQERIFRQKADAITAANAEAAERTRKRYREQRNETANADGQEDGPLAPVLRHTLDSLPEPEKPTAVDRGASGRATLSIQVSGWADASRP